MFDSLIKFSYAPEVSNSQVAGVFFKLHSQEGKLKSSFTQEGNCFWKKLLELETLRKIIVTIKLKKI